MFFFRSEPFSLGVNVNEMDLMKPFTIDESLPEFIDPFEKIEHSLEERSRAMRAENVVATYQHAKQQGIEMPLILKNPLQV